MAYSFVRAVALPRSAGAQWASPNITTVSLLNLYLTYEELYVVLTHTAIVGEVYVDMNLYRSTYSSYAFNISTWLSTEIGTDSLLHSDTLPSEHITFASYANSVAQRYKIALATPHPDDPDNYLDLRLSRPSYTTDLELIHNYSLVSVNGFIHITQNSTNNTILIKDGATTAKRSRLNHVGLTSFFNMGDMVKLPILPNNIHKLTPTSTLMDGLTFSVTLPNNFDLDNKSYILVLGGYMVFVNDGTIEPVAINNPGTFWRNGNNSFRVNLNNLNYLNRIFESNQYIDLSSLGVDNLNEPSTVDIQELMSDASILKYFQLSQSFLVVINTPKLFVKTITIRDHNTPGHFTTNIEPKYPLCVGYGRIAEYNKEPSDDGWAVTVADSYTRRFVFGYKRPVDDGLVSDQLVPYAPYSSLAGKLIQISSHQTV